MNYQRNARPFHGKSGFVLFGSAVLFFLSLISYDPSDVPSYIPLISTIAPCNPVTKNYIGLVGTVCAGYSYFLFGSGSYLIAMLLVAFGISKSSCQVSFKERLGWGLVLLLTFCALAERQPWFFHDWKEKFGIEGPGGWFGYSLSQACTPLGTVGAVVVLLNFYIASLIFSTGFHPIDFLRQITQDVLFFFQKRRDNRLRQSDELSWVEARKKVLEKQAAKLERQLKRKKAKAHSIPESAIQQPKIVDTSLPAQQSTSVPIENPLGTRLTDLVLENYTLPPVNLLDPPEIHEVVHTDPEVLKNTQMMILQLLKQFSVEAKPGDITKGPTITRYEIYPAEGVRVDRILSLEKDIARATCADGINILAPIPGKNTVGIEIANSEKVKVTLRELFETDTWLQSKAYLPIALGKDVYGHTLLADLTKMPHLLLAGTTGSGKSVCINAIIASLISRYSPKSLRFIMVDPKVVEMQCFNTLPHLITPVITNPRRVLNVLRWIIGEMENRYRIFAECGVRNIQGFNLRPRATSPVQSGPTPSLNSDDVLIDLPQKKRALPVDGEINIPMRLGYIVVIIDELADLIQTAPSDIENAIVRIAQMARAAGIHLIIATQTPRADVVTGLIKANIPSRIAFQVASKIDSRVILDENGAEKLLGQGDMLYLSTGASKLLRAQGVLVTDEEIQRLVNFASSQLAHHHKSSIQDGTGESEDICQDECG